MPDAPDSAIAARGYAHPEALVTTQWVADHAGDPGVRVFECDEDVLLYDLGHVPGAQKLDWHTDLNDPVERDYVGRAAFQALLRRLGVDSSHVLVFYGDKNNWWATYALWVFRLFGWDMAQLKVMDGGRAKWEAEERDWSIERPQYEPTSYHAPERDDARVRAFRDDVLAHLRAGRPMIDVRSAPEFTGERTHMPDYPQEGTLRGGHIPGAQNVPWARAAEVDGTFKSANALRAIYEGEAGLARGDDVVTYCRIGERSSHTWFVLTQLLGYERVRNYDGSWTEWGNAVRSPIETGAGRPRGEGGGHG